MPYGYHGKILHVDLTTRTLWVEQPDADWYRLYMGGSNFGLYYILKQMARRRRRPWARQRAHLYALSRHGRRLLGSEPDDAQCQVTRSPGALATRRQAASSLPNSSSPVSTASF